MPGSSRAVLERRRNPANSARYRAGALAGGFAVAIGVSQCGFPDYGYLAAAAGVSNSNGGSAYGGSAGFGGIGSVGGDPAGSAGRALGGQPSAAGAGGVPSDSAAGAGAEAGAAGEAGARPAECVFPPPVIYPDHCFDRVLNGGETGADCGGSECAACSATEGCNRDSDCASALCTNGKTCSQSVSLSYTAIDTGAFTRTPKFKLEIKYLDTSPAALADLRVRYYFNHGGAAEPVITEHTQAVFSVGDAQQDIARSVGYRIFRFPMGPNVQGVATDSYLEITFSGVTQLSPGATLDLTQDIDAGSGDYPFQQTTHYSFVGGTAGADNRAITVFLGARRLWGVEPPMNVLPDCAFVAGVNLGGPAVPIGMHTFASSAAAQVDFPGTVYQSSATPYPGADAGISTLLGTGFTLANQTATWPVPNGKYWAYAWLTSAGMDSGQLIVQDTPADRFYGLVSSTTAGWARVGPYAVDVGATGGLRLTATGAVHVTGVELYNAAP